jgi:phenylacetate-CoA ligase
VFQNMMGYGLFTGGLGLPYAPSGLGCMVIPSSTGNTLRQIQLMQDFNTTIISHHPELRAAPRRRDQYSRASIPATLTVKKAYLGAEPYSEATRDKIEEQWGLAAYNSYGMSGE